MVTSTTLDQPLIEVTNSRGQKNVVVSSMVNNDVYTLTLTDGSVVQLRVQNDLSSSQQQQQQHPQQLVHQQPPTEDITDLDNVSQTWLPSHSVSNGRSSSVPPASFAEEVTLPFTVNSSSNSGDIMVSP